MLKSRLKWITFLICGIVFYCLLIWLFISIFLTLTITQSLLTIGGILVLWIIIWLIISNTIESNTFLISPFLIFTKRKWIWHNKLGYFLIFIRENKLEVNQVNWFSITEKFTLDNSDNLKNTISQLKDRLDDSYKNYLSYMNHINEEKEKLKSFENWDGLLIDEDERRDMRIENILKKK